MLSKEAIDYINLLKHTPLNNISREMVEKGFEIIDREIKDFDPLFHLPEDLALLQSSLNTLETREVFTLYKSYLEKSKIRHTINMKKILNMKDTLNRIFTQLSIRAAEQRMNSRLDKIQEQNAKINHQVGKALVQLDNSIGDLKYFTLMKFNAIDEKTSSHELEKIQESMINSAAKNDVMRHIGTLLAYALQVKIAIPNILNLPHDFSNDIQLLNEILNEAERKLNIHNDELQSKDLNIEQLSAMQRNVVKVQQKLEETMVPIIEKVKRNMMANKSGTFLFDYQMYDLPKSILDGMGDDIKVLGYNKKQIEQETSRRAEFLGKMHDQKHPAKRLKEDSSDEKMDIRTQLIEGVSSNTHENSTKENADDLKDKSKVRR